MGNTFAWGGGGRGGMAGFFVKNDCVNNEKYIVVELLQMEKMVSS